MRTFVNWLTEMQQGNVSKIGASMNKFIREPDETAFNELFGGKKRILVSPSGDNEQTIQNFIQELEKEGVKVTIDDLKKGTATEIVKTQQGQKERQVSIGTILSRKKLTSLLGTWSIVKEKVNNLEDWTIIVSRYPLDLLRMSDHVDERGRQISSCHSPGGGWFHCAIQEAKTGGAIAYAIKLDDLAKIKDLQAKDVFKDRDRGVEGIVPLERVRLRRFHSEQHGDLLVPELRTYQTHVKIEGFQQAVADWAMEAQEETVQKLIAAYGNIANAYTKMKFRGGSYQDNKTSEIWNRFFGTNLSPNKKTSTDQDDESEKEEQPEYMDAADWEDQARAFVAQHRERWKHSDDIEVDFDAEEPDNGGWGDAGDAYGVRWSAHITFYFEKDEEGITSIPKRVEELKGITKFLAEYYNEINKITYHYDGENGCRVDVISKKLPDEYGELDEFEGFLDGVDTLDENYQKIHAFILEWFTHKGFRHNPILAVAKEYNYQNFVLEFLGNKHDEHHYEIKTKPIELDLGGIPADPAVCYTTPYGSETRFAIQHDVAQPEFPEFVEVPKVSRSLKGTDNKLMVRPFGWHMLCSKDKAPYYFSNKIYNANQTKEQKYFTPDFKVELYLIYGMRYEDDVRPVFEACRQMDNDFDRFKQEVGEWWREVKVACNKVVLKHPPIAADSDNSTQTTPPSV